MGNDRYLRHPLSWRSRAVWAVAALLALMLALRLVWGWYAGRSLASQTEILRRRGVPVDESSIRYSTAKDEDNAWALQMKAATVAQGTGVDCPASSNLEYAGYPPYGPLWIRAAAASERAHAEVFKLARQARDRQGVQIRQPGVPLQRAAIATGSFNSARHLANVLGDGALYAQTQLHDDHEAVERLFDLLHVARSLRHDNFMVGQLVGTGVEALAAYRIQILAPHLRIEGATTDGGARAATREQVKALIDLLADERHIWEGIRLSLETERVYANELQKQSGQEVWATRPVSDAVRRRNNRLFDALAETIRADRPNKPDMAKRIAAAGSDENDIQRPSQWFTLTLTPMTRYMETTFRVVGDRRATAVSVAAQLYRADHGGNWPKALTDLVPAYLPGAPADPYRADAGPLGYVIKTWPDGSPRPLVFYEAGEWQDWPLPPTPLFGWNNDPVNRGAARREIRQYRDLSMPPGAVSTKPVEHDPNEPDAPGEQDQPNQR